MATVISLQDSARQVVRTCARVQPGELVCIAADTHTVAIAHVLAQAVREVGAEPVLVVMEPRKAHGNEPPRVVAAAMKAADVVLQPVTYAMTHTDATQEALRAGARVLVLRGVTEEIMTHGAMLADYDAIDRITREVARRLSAAHTVRVRTPAGTDLTMSVAGRTAVALTGRVGGPGTFAAMPDGEAAISPVEGTAEGTLVVEHTMDNLGLLDAPIRMTVRGGRVVEIAGGEAAARLRAMVAAADPNATNIAEFAIGTNDRARLIGSMTEDKKVRGTVHVAIGDNHVIGGTVTSELHLDGLLLRPTVELDGQVVVQEGQLLVT
ncbi:MAG: aminopeptidase [Armatimonadota bacterium]|nr:aminopeptidase [Armatimonadota bacterium]